MDPGEPQRPQRKRSRNWFTQRVWSQWHRVATPPINVRVQSHIDEKFVPWHCSRRPVGGPLGGGPCDYMQTLYRYGCYGHRGSVEMAGPENSTPGLSVCVQEGHSRWVLLISSAHAATAIYKAMASARISKSPSPHSNSQCLLLLTLRFLRPRVTRSLLAWVLFSLEVWCSPPSA